MSIILLNYSFSIASYSLWEHVDIQQTPMLLDSNAPSCDGTEKILSECSNFHGATFVYGHCHYAAAVLCTGKTLFMLLNFFNLKLTAYTTEFLKTVF